MLTRIVAVKLVTAAAAIMNETTMLLNGCDQMTKLHMESFTEAMKQREGVPGNGFGIIQSATKESAVH